MKSKEPEVTLLECSPYATFPRQRSRNPGAARRRPRPRCPLCLRLHRCAVRVGTKRFCWECLTDEQKTEAMMLFKLGGSP
jgi:hypothetical protein